MQFELMRLSLAETAQGSLFADPAPAGERRTREQWLRDVFSRQHEFMHRGHTFHYRPATDPGEAVPGNLLVGRIGRQIIVDENAPPEAGFEDTERPSWRASYVMIDPTSHPDGQKAAMGHLPTVGAPLAVFGALVDYLNNADAPFTIEVHAIVPKDSFWEFVNEHSGAITWVQFEFVAPNMFGPADDYDREMRDMKEQERVQKAKMSIESRDGLQLYTPRVRRAVDYTEKGTGSIRAKAKNKKTYNSRAKAKRVNISNDEIDAMPKRGLFNLLFERIFGP